MPVNDIERLVTVLYEDGSPAELHIEEPDNESILNNIYVGHVTKVLQNTGAFIRFDGKNEGFLPIGKFAHAVFKNKDGNKELKAEDELLVTVDAEAVKTKHPVLTTELKVMGKNLIISNFFSGAAFSHKLDKQQKKDISDAINAVETDFGFIVRTSAGGADESILRDEACELAKRLDEIIRIGKTRTQGTCIFKAEDVYEDKLKRLDPEVTEAVVTDDAEIYKRLCESKTSEKISDKIRLYDDRMVSLYRLYNFSTIIDRALDKKVMMKSGAYLVIEQTEAFVSIDVNSGKKVNKKKDDEYIYKINLEAAGEAARQIRLRQLSGTILIDFINMKKSIFKEKLIETMKEHVKYDPVSTEVIDMTALGIMELTRKKRGRSLKEQL